ncbi:MAG: hypothetical protein V3V08_03725 [Nannocystaceae bacterium]
MFPSRPCLCVQFPFNPEACEQLRLQFGQSRLELARHVDQCPLCRCRVKGDIIDLGVDSCVFELPLTKIVSEEIDGNGGDTLVVIAERNIFAFSTREEQAWQERYAAEDKGQIVDLMVCHGVPWLEACC